MKKKFLLILCVLALIVALTVGVVIYQKSIPKEYIKLNEYTAIAIHNDLYKNEISGREKWNDTDVIIIGTVKHIYDASFAMDLRYGNCVGSTRVHTTKKEILKLNRDDRVKVSGEMTGVGFWDGALSIYIDADEIIKQ